MQNVIFLRADVYFLKFSGIILGSPLKTHYFSDVHKLI